MSTGAEIQLRETEALERVQATLEADTNLVVPETGELVDLRDLEAVATLLADDRERASRLQERIAFLSAVVRLESRRQGTKTLRLDSGRVLTLSGGETTGYDPGALEAALEEAGVPIERLRDIIRVTVTYKVDRTKLRSLMSANPDYAAAAATAARPEYNRVQVTVK